VLIADDDAIVRDTLRNELIVVSDIDVISEADDAQVVVEQSANLQPHVVLLDFELPHLPIPTLIMQLRDAANSPNVVILGSDDTLDAALKSIRAGASGYFFRGDALSLMAHIIRAAYSGLVCFSPMIGQWWREELAEALAPAQPTSSGETLSEREREVLQCMALGLSNQQIAEKLTISSATVKNHVNSIYGKPGMHSRREAIAWAWRSGLVERNNE
jgi:DNA-binding NarL/FixJ family response regulator